MGQCKLKTKYQTPGDVRRNKSRSRSSSGEGAGKLPKIKSDNKKPVRMASAKVLRKRKEKQTTAAKSEIDMTITSSDVRSAAHLRKAH